MRKNEKFIYVFLIPFISLTIISCGEKDESSDSSSSSGTTTTTTSTTDDTGLYLTVGSTGTILGSTDRSTWTSMKSGIKSADLYLDHYGVAYGNSTFVAVGEEGIIHTSSKISNNISWTSRTIEVVQRDNALHNPDFLDVTYGSKLFVVVGSPATILTSTDGITWTQRTSGTTSWLESVTYGNSTFVIVDSLGNIHTSSDGTSWINGTSGSALELNAVTYIE